jgi:hypothetical protein
MRFLTYGLWAVLLSAGCSGSLGTLAAGGMGGAGSGGAGTAGTVGSAGSPGTTTLQLALAPTQTYCDENASCTSTQHLFLRTLAGQPLMLGSVGCGTSCSTCAPNLCPDIPIVCPAGNWATAVTDSTFTWDGSYTENGSCEPSGASVAITCMATTIAPVGTYVARFCATPGTLGTSDGGARSCAATGAQECVEVQFDFPSSQPVLVALPSD